MSGVLPTGWWGRLPSGKPVSRVGFGCSSLWAKPSFPEAAAHDILLHLADNGMNVFDTAPLYGAGCGERRLARLLKERRPGDLVISTKVGHNLIDGQIVRSFDPGLMRRSLEGSLKRLGLDRVDVLFLHGPEVRDLTDEVAGWLQELKHQGLIGLSGVNSFDNAVLERTAQLPIDAVMLQYSAADFRNAVVMQKLVTAGKLVFSGTALGRASFDPARFLPIDRTRLWYLLRMLRHDPGALLRAGPLRRALVQTDADPYAAAIRFMAWHPQVLTSLFGTSSLGHAAANLANAKRQLTVSEWQTLAARLNAPGFAHD